MPAYLYRATSAQANPQSTFDLAIHRQLIVRNVFNRLGRAIPHVKHLRPLDDLLLWHSHHDPQQVLRVTIAQANQPHPAAPAIDRIYGDEALELAALGYALLPGNYLEVIRLQNWETVNLPANMPMPNRNTLTPYFV